MLRLVRRYLDKNLGLSSAELVPHKPLPFENPLSLLFCFCVLSESLSNPVLSFLFSITIDLRAELQTIAYSKQQQGRRRYETQRAENHDELRGFSHTLHCKYLQPSYSYCVCYFFHCCWNVIMICNGSIQITQ